MTHAEIEITAELVRDLVRDQHPDLADRPVRLGARGWDNQLWRLGDDLAVRLPWATGSADALLRKEYSWLPTLAPRLPLPIPIPQRFGEPSERFPRPWLITTWVPGTPADRIPVTRAADAAKSLATFLTALHQPAPGGAPAGRDRGGPLADRADQFAKAVTSATERGLIQDPDAARAVWHDAVTAPQWTGPAHMTSPPCGSCYRTTPPTTSTRPTSRPRTPPPCAAPAAGRWHAPSTASSSATPASTAAPGGKPTWGPPAHATLQRLTATTR